jgi:hypothetical protein
VRSDGYVDLWRPGHPLARVDGYVFEHRQMAWDAGLLTDASDEVHHVNHQRGDNRLDNFEIKTTVTHAREHAWGRGTITNQFGTFVVQEHSAAAYKRGCRCSICTQANTDQCRAYRARKLST